MLMSTWKNHYYIVQRNENKDTGYLISHQKAIIKVQIKSRNCRRKTYNLAVTNAP